MGKREILLAIAGLIAGAAVLLFWLSPRVTEVNIETNSPSNWQPIQIRFSQPIDPDTLAGKFDISPKVEGELMVDGDKLIFSPSEAYAYDQEYQVTLRSGVRGLNSLPYLRSSRWPFTLAEPQLVFLRQNGEIVNLWLKNQAGLAVQISNEPLGIWDYSIVPQGQGILYSALSSDSSMDLVLWRSDETTENILDCLDSLCRSAVWQPDGQLVAYERVPLDTANAPAEVWLLDTVTGEQAPTHDPALHEEIAVESLSSHSPQWSADGRYLSYYHSDGRLLIVKDMLGGRATLIPSNIELMGRWSPVDQLLAYTELTFGSETPEEHEEGLNEVHAEGSSLPLFNHLIVTDPVNDAARDLSEGQESEDGLPAWHPDGSLLALGKSITGAGKQLWLVPIDGQEATVLTDDPLANHSAPSWSPDGRKLAYMRFEMADAAGFPGIWLHDFESGQQRLVEEDAFLPGWLD